MKAITLNAATKLAVSTVPCTLTRVQGYYKAAADAWLQIFDSAAEPAAGTVPTKSYALPLNSPYSWAFDPGTLTLNNGCYVAVSSTEGTYTTVAYSAGVTYADIEVDYGPNAAMNASYVVKGDLTTNRNNLTVWSDAAAQANNRLYQIDFTNNSGVPVWLMLFSYATFGVQPRVILGGKAGVADGTSITFTFGAEGLMMMGEEPLTATSGAAHYGCYIEVTSDPTGFVVVNSGTLNIRAYSKA